MRTELSFLARVYPRIVLQTLRDPRFRWARQVDQEIVVRGKGLWGMR